VPIRAGRQGCSVEGCERPHEARGWCSAHYERWRKDGTVRPAVPVRAWTGGEAAALACVWVSDDASWSSKHRARRFAEGEGKVYVEAPRSLIKILLKRGAERVA